MEFMALSGFFLTFGGGRENESFKEGGIFMVKRLIFLSVLLLIPMLFLFSVTPEKLIFSSYHRPEEVSALLKSYAAKFPQLAKIVVMGKSTARTDIEVLRVAAFRKGLPDPDSRPAVFIAANIEGAHLAGTEASLGVIEELLTKYGSDKDITSLLDFRTIYVAPLLNPDAARNFFASTRYERFSNSRPVDEDLDDQVDEDSFEDLNKDGWITQMRVKDPEGKWIADPKEPRLMRLADSKNGEKGIYNLYTEGIDNDGDGLYNEDPPGGVELNRNFPHDFEYHTKAAGLWPVSEPETTALVKFLVSHPSIALVLNFSTENTILNLQQTGQVRAAGDRVRIPRQYATFLGLDPEAEYTLKEITEMIKASPFAAGQEISEDMVAMFLGLGPAVQIDRSDLPLFEAIQKEYKDSLKEAKIDYPERRAKGVGKGSFIAYCYYQYGVPVFSVDLWAVPEPKKEAGKESLSPDWLKSMTPEQFIALGEEKIDSFLKEQGAPPNFNAKMLVNMVKSGQVTPGRMAEMVEKMSRPAQVGTEAEEHPDAYLLKWSDTVLKGKGFVPWTPLKHPTLGEVEVGGFIPYLKINPPPEELEKTISFHVNFYLKLMKRMAEIRFANVKAESLGGDLYLICAYLTNEGWFPTSTAQGRKALTSWPIRVQVKLERGQSLFAGRPVEIVPFLGGSGETRKVEWTIKGKKESKVTIIATSPKLGKIETELILY